MRQRCSVLLQGFASSQDGFRNSRGSLWAQNGVEPGVQIVRCPENGFFHRYRLAGRVHLYGLPEHPAFYQFPRFQLVDEPGQRGGSDGQLLGQFFLGDAGFCVVG